MKQTWFPNVEELARLAAIVSNGKTENAADNVAYSLELYRESEIALRKLAMNEGIVSEYNAATASLDNTFLRLAEMAKLKEWETTVTQAKNYPANLDDFLGLIVNGRTKADSTKRFRDFLSQEAAWDKPENHLMRIKTGDCEGGFFNKSKWLAIGGKYLEWWKNQRTQKSSDAAKTKSNPST